MNEVEKRSNLLGLIILFFVFTLTGILLSFFYVIFQTSATDIWANIIGTFVISGVLAGIAWVIKRLLKITNNAMALLVVAIGIVIVLYVMWSMWFVSMFEFYYGTGQLFGIRDIGTLFAETRAMVFDSPEFMNFLRHFNEYGTWTINDNAWTGAILWVVWAGETLIILSIPLLAAYASAGLFISEIGAWVEERLMNYGFTAFDDHELDRIGMGEIDPILEKPLETRNGSMNAVAVCYHKGEATDFIAVYKAHWDKEGALSKGRHIMTVNIGAEKIDTLDSGLQAKHYPSMAKKSESPVEPIAQEAASDEMLETPNDPVVNKEPAIDDTNMQNGSNDILD